MSFSIQSPSSLLKPFVQHYWSLECRHNFGQMHLQRIVPTGLPELIFYLENKPEFVNQSRGITSEALISGQNTSWYDLRIGGTVRIFAVLFKPAGLTAFMGIPVSELNNINVPLHLILRNQSEEITDELHQATSFLEQTKKMDAYLLKRVYSRHPSDYLKRINHCVEYVLQRKGLVRVNELASLACLSSKQFERYFSSLVGCTTGKFCKIVRFQSSIYYQSLQPDASLTALAYQSGYYDQSHMINEYKRLTGLSPKEFFRDCEAQSDLFLKV